MALAAFGVLLLVLAFLRLKESLPAELRRTGGTSAALRSYGSLVRDWSFFGLALLGGFYMAAMFTYISASTFVFQEQFGLSAQEYAIIFGAGAVSVTIGSQVNGALVGRVTPEQILRVIVPVGIVLSAGLLAATLSGAGLPVLVALIVLTLGTAGFVMPSVPAVALERNAHRAGSAAALLGAMQFGVGAGIAPLTGLIGGDTTVMMAAVMFGVISIAGLLLLSLTRSLRAAPVGGLAAGPPPWHWPPPTHPGPPRRRSSAATSPRSGSSPRPTLSSRRNQLSLITGHHLSRHERLARWCPSSTGRAFASGKRYR
ncbi:MFS transporter [Oerskovia sp. M15]